jgi:hypothetical protein
MTLKRSSILESNVYKFLKCVAGNNSKERSSIGPRSILPTYQISRHKRSPRVLRKVHLASSHFLDSHADTDRPY